MSRRAVLLEDEVVRRQIIAVLDQFRQQIVSVVFGINLSLICDEMKTSLAYYWAREIKGKTAKIIGINYNMLG